MAHLWFHPEAGSATTTTTTTSRLHDSLTASHFASTLTEGVPPAEAQADLWLMQGVMGAARGRWRLGLANERHHSWR